MKDVNLRKPGVGVDDAIVHDAIRRRAFELFEARGRVDGHDLEDWFRAEEEIRTRKSDAAAA